MAVPVLADGLADYSTSPGSNVFLFPEPMPAGQVNDAARQLMADVRGFYQAPQWIDLGLAPTQLNSNTFLVAGDRTSFFPAGRRIRADDILTYYGTVSSSIYSAPNTSVELNMDSGDLTSSLERIYVGLVDGQSKPIPASAISGSLVSVGLEAPATFAVSRTPVTSSNTISLTWVAQPSNTILAGPVFGNSATPTFRSISSSDVPFLVTDTSAGLTLTVPNVSATHVSGAGLTFINRVTASNSASLTITGISGAYTNYVLVLTEIVAATNNVSLLLTMSADGGATFFGGTNYATRIFNLEGTGTAGLSNSSIILTPHAQSNAAGTSVNGNMYIYSPLSTTRWKRISYSGTYNNQADTASLGAFGTGGFTSATTPINALNLKFSSGNIASGSATLYGLSDQ